MKQRAGFVSNSSSSSFVLRMKFVSPEQKAKIEDWKASSRRLAESSSRYAPFYLWPEEVGLGGIGWDIKFFDDVAEFYTHMDNFDMQEYLLALGIPDEAIVGR